MQLVPGVDEDAKAVLRAKRGVLPSKRDLRSDSGRAELHAADRIDHGLSFLRGGTAQLDGDCNGCHTADPSTQYTAPGNPTC